MGTQNSSAPACAQPLNPRGVTHINTPHTTRFTIVGNHLAQHRKLSLTAIGLAVHIQSLPGQSRVDIKTLAGRFTEGETRIAAALRELKAHGYLAQVRERLSNGRFVTHTVSYNQPQPQPLTASTPCPDALPDCPPQPAEPRDALPPPRQEAPPAQRTGPEPKTAPEPASEPATKPPLPEPRTPDIERHRTAAALLATLHHDDRRLVLPERDVRRLTPAVAAWLERGVSSEAVRHSLTANLPPKPRHPAALLAHRLTECLPPPAPTPPSSLSSGETHAVPSPLHSCEGCERAIRTPAPGAYCRACREAGLDINAAA
ncbi:helix-turn-helix domain-containing protein [Streptomyces sp900105755]|uniref:helix-turn-helix domain-containing protein n=1 Tax=Streptomyces sp. 900105755 TaxID=3154389 RepID=UPI003334977D